MAAEKEYTGCITLGATTPTYDLESAPENEMPFHHISEDQIRTAAKSFEGIIQQFPPVYSAIKKDGVALYELARRGTEVELEAREIRIDLFEITEIDLPQIFFKVKCGTGTYIRSLAHDLGTALGCGAYLSSLRRTAIGNNRVEDSTTLEHWLDRLEAENSNARMDN